MSEQKGYDRQADAPEPPRRPVRMCVRCQTVTDNPTVVYEVHQNTGPGFNVYACEACASLFPPAPDVFAFLPVRRRPAEGGR